MNAEDRERQLNEWLDDALGRYSEAEPRAGLEQRILANLEAQREARRPWWQSAWIPVAAAVLISSGVLWMARHKAPSPAPVAKIETKAPEPRSPEQVAPAIAKAAPPRAHRLTKVTEPVQVAGVKEDLPRQDVFPSRDGTGATFPSRAPLNTQEVALIRLAKRDPEEVRTIAQAQEADRQRLAKMFEQSGAPQK